MSTIVRIKRIPSGLAIHNQANTIRREVIETPHMSKLMGSQETVYAKAKMVKGEVVVENLIANQGW